MEFCVRAETEVAGAPTGGMDQAVAILSAPGQALLIDFDESSASDVDLHLIDHGLELLVIDSAVSHALVDGGYGARRADCEAAAAALGLRSLRHATLDDVRRLDDPRLQRRVRHVVTEIARVTEAVAAIDARDYEALGEVFLASHASLRDDFEVSCPELDVIVERTTALGALGARMTGGGFGGSAVALLESERVSTCRPCRSGGVPRQGLGSPTLPQGLGVLAAGLVWPPTAKWAKPSRFDASDAGHSRAVRDRPALG